MFGFSVAHMEIILVWSCGWHNTFAHLMAHLKSLVLWLSGTKMTRKKVPLFNDTVFGFNAADTSASAVKHLVGDKYFQRLVKILLLQL